MEQGLILGRLGVQAGEAESMSPILLAYLGDAVYDLLVREYVLARYPGHVHLVNQEKTRLVCAHAQSEIMGFLMAGGVLRPGEDGIYRRARNHKTESHSKNSSAQEYHRATGFEALIGYLYLRGETERMAELVAAGIRHLEEMRK